MRKFRSLWSVSALVLALSPGLAAASDQDAFVGLLRRFGITDNIVTSKKPCLCTGGVVGSQIGVLTIAQEGAGNSFVHACFIPRYDSAGGFQAAVNCVSAGGTFALVPK